MIKNKNKGWFKNYSNFRIHKRDIQKLPAKL